MMAQVDLLEYRVYNTWGPVHSLVSNLKPSVTFRMLGTSMEHNLGMTKGRGNRTRCIVRAKMTQQWNIIFLSIQNGNVVCCARRWPTYAIRIIKGKSDRLIGIGECNCPFTVYIAGVGGRPVGRLDASSVSGQDSSTVQRKCWNNHFRGI